MIGAHTNDIVEVEMPSGIMKYKVLEIQKTYKADNGRIAQIRLNDR